MSEKSIITGLLKGMPNISKVIRFWPYSRFLTKRPAMHEIARYPYNSKTTKEKENIRKQMSEITSPQNPFHHIDNKSGWEVEFENGKRGFFHFYDNDLVIYEADDDYVPLSDEEVRGYKL